MYQRFRDRKDAGQQLARQLLRLPDTDLVVLGLPRGGVPVAAEVAEVLHAPLGVILVAKLGLPFQPEVAMGAIAEGGVRVFDVELISKLHITDEEVARVEEAERSRLADRLALLGAAGDRVDVTGRVAIVVDDGIATGATASAACQVARRRGARKVIVAAPVGGPDALRRVRGADLIVCPLRPRDFCSVGAYYQNFEQTTEKAVIALLEENRHRLQVERDRA